MRQVRWAIRTSVLGSLGIAARLTGLYRPTILMYHSIDDSHSAISVSPAKFCVQLRYVKENGYQVLSLAELAFLSRAGRKLAPKTVVLTFDDGFANNLTVALPILKDFGFKATVFVATGYCGGSNVWGNPSNPRFPTLTWPQLLQLSKEGIEIGAHTVSHPKLTKVPLAQAKEEIANSKRMLEEDLGQAVLSLAYPHGSYNQQIRDLVEEAGFAVACTIESGTVQCGDDLFLLKRVYVRDSMSMVEFKASLTSAIDWYARLKNLTMIGDRFWEGST